MTIRPVSTRPAPTRPGIALLTALVVVLLLTMFLSELFFATGMELRSLESFKDSGQARRLAQSALKATEIGLLNDEADFFAGYRQMQQLMTLSSLPLEGGLLITLDIVPADSKFNLNDIANLQPDSPRDRARFAVFQNLMAEIMIPAQEASLPSTPIPEQFVSQIYASLVNWMSAPASSYSAPDGTPGGRLADYQGTQPEYAPKYAPLDRLEEMRLVRGYEDANIPWPEIEKRFTVRAKSTGATGGSLFTERVNVNIASREEIMEFLLSHRVEDSRVLSDGQNGSIQKDINKYADNAQEVANALVPDGLIRPTYNDGSIKQTLVAAGLGGNSSNQIFSAISQYYRVNITTEVNGIQSHLSALVYVNRNPSDRTGKSAEVQQYDLN